jgi:hypothetical protein
MLKVRHQYVHEYGSNGLLVFDKPKSTNKLCEWLTSFQKEVDALTCSKHLQFTVDIWNPESSKDLQKGSLPLPRDETPLVRSRFEL